MNNRVVAILFSAFVVAAACSYLIFRIEGNHLSASRQQVTRVVVAANDVRMGSVLRDSDLATMAISGAAPKGAILRRQDAIGRNVISTIYQGEPIFENRLAASGSGGGLAATIPPGMRACAIKVDDVVGVAGFVTPGMHVDVLISGNPPGAAANTSQGPRVKTLLQNIEVLSAGTDTQRGGEWKPEHVQVVNLLVTPDQAEYLSLASTQTHIQLVLRNPLDNNISEPPGTAMSSLFADKNQPQPAPRARLTAAAPLPKKPAAPEIYSVKVYNGSKQSEAKFATGEEKE